ncbi:unnamed protein product [Symbiodinium natans]|uniref:Uncharacterized protein n=1 Tax=Symbiodinium natans TaxID=878477 RepID=A0A812M546_9DINO|nr:unnamed protein product [Symbiodinium natans]
MEASFRGLESQVHECEDSNLLVVLTTSEVVPKAFPLPLSGQRRVAPQPPAVTSTGPHRQAPELGRPTSMTGDCRVAALGHILARMCLGTGTLECRVTPNPKGPKPYTAWAPAAWPFSSQPRTSAGTRRLGCDSATFQLT